MKTPTRRKAAPPSTKQRQARAARASAKVTKATGKPKATDGEWLTPTQISHEDGMPPHTVQLLYGYVRTSKLEARRVEGSKGQVVPAAFARELIANRGSRGGSRGPRPSVRKAPSGLKQGTILSHEESAGVGKGRDVPKGKRRVVVVTDTGRSLGYSHDGHSDSFWRTDEMAKRIKEGTTTIEHPAHLLAIVAYHYRMNDEEGLAKQLMEWASGRVNEAGVVYNRLMGLAPKDLAQEGDEPEGGSDED